MALFVTFFSSAYAQAEPLRQQTHQPIHCRPVIKLAPRYGYHHESRQFQLAAAPRIMGDAFGARMVGVAIVFDAQLSFRPT